MASRRHIDRLSPAIERVQTNAVLLMLLKFETCWRDGAAHWVMSPLEFMHRLAVQANQSQRLVRFTFAWQ